MSSRRRGDDAATDAATTQALYTGERFPSDLSSTDAVSRAYGAAPESAGLLPPELIQGATAALLAVALYLGPDWLLAPLGWDTNIRPGRSAVAWLGEALDGDSDFSRERRDGYDAPVPVAVAAAAAAVFLVLGAAGEALLVDALGSSTAFVGAWAACGVIAGSVYEVGRPAILNREEAEAEATFEQAFADFAERRFDASTPTAATNATARAGGIIVSGESSTWISARRPRRAAIRRL